MAQEKAALSKIAGGNLAHMLWQRCISQKEFAAIVDRTPRTVRRWMYEILFSGPDKAALWWLLSLFVLLCSLVHIG